MKNESRLVTHQRNTQVEEILRELSEIIKDPDSQPVDNTFPVFYIVGVARSGTTIVTQFLSQFKQLHYPSNLLSRFFFAPYTGSLIQKLLVDLDHKGELLGSLRNDLLFSSDLGKTQGILSPNEFWYYWRRFFVFGKTESELLKADFKGFVNGLRQVQKVFPHPLFLKGMLMNWHLQQLYLHQPEAYFIFIEREAFFNAQSLLQSRKAFFGDLSKWYSFKPAEYRILEEKSPAEQVAGQVHYTNAAIAQELEKIPESHYITLQYEDFCKDTSILFGFVSDVCSRYDIELSTEYPSHFEIKNQVRIDPEMEKELRKSIKLYG